MTILNPSNLETIDYAQQGWNAIITSNMERINDKVIFRNDDDNFIIDAPAAAAADPELANSKLHMYVDEGGNILKFKIRKSGGGIITLDLGTTSGAPPWPPDYRSGLNCEFVSDSSVKINIGKARDETNSFNLFSVAPLTIDISSKLDTGSESASQVYDIYLIWHSVADTYDGLFVMTGDSPVMPSGYDYRRKVGSVANDGINNFIEFYQCCAMRSLFEDTSKTQVLIGGAATSWTNIDLSDYVPAGTTDALLMIDCNKDTLTRKNGSTVNYQNFVPAAHANTVNQLLDTNRIFEYETSAGTGTDIYLIGYFGG